MPLGDEDEPLVLPDALPEVLPDAPLDWSGGVDPEVEPVAPPLIEAEPLVEPEVLGVALLELLEELGGVVVSVGADALLGGVVVVVADGLVDVLLVPDLLRSQPVTAAVATASTATKGMSLFMTSPFGRVVGLGRTALRPATALLQGRGCRTHASAPFPLETGGSGKVPATNFPFIGEIPDNQLKPCRCK